MTPRMYQGRALRRADRALYLICGLFAGACLVFVLMGQALALLDRMVAK